MSLKSDQFLSNWGCWPLPPTGGELGATRSLTVDVCLHMGRNMIFLSGDVLATSRGVLPIEVICEQDVLDLLNCGVKLNPLGGVSLHLPST